MRALRLAICAAALTQSAGAQDAKPSCVDVEIGSAQSYACLNRQLGAIAQEAGKSGNDLTPPTAATAPENSTGAFNATSLHDRLGGNFGHSVTPPRPTTVVTNPIAPR